MQACHYMVNFSPIIYFQTIEVIRKRTKGDYEAFHCWSLKTNRQMWPNIYRAGPASVLRGHKTRYYSPDQIINPPLLPCSNNVPLPAQSPFIADQKRSGLESSCKQLILETSSLWHGSTGSWHGGGAAHCTQCQKKCYRTRL